MIWVTILKFLKPLAPYILAALAVLFAYTWIYNKGFNAGKDDGYAKAIDETKKIVQKMNFKCPDVKPCPPVIDYDKIRGRNIAINLVQHNSVQIDGDSLVLKQFSDVVKSQLESLEVVRTKRR
jgi:hypothetical protein